MKRLVGPVAAAVALAVVAGVSVARVTRPVGVLEALERAQPERVFAARVSIEAGYRRCAVEKALIDSVATRCAEAGDTRLSLDELTAAGESLDPDSLRASALAAMFWRHEQDELDRAIERLFRALEVTDNPLPVMVDLSAAHLVRAAQTRNGKDAPRALDYALWALELDSANLPALFNVALASEAMYLVEGAEEAWNAYLAVDSTSPWADEARRRRDAFRRAYARVVEPSAASPVEDVTAFAKHHAQRARELGWERVLRDWGKAVLEGKTAQADTMLHFAERVGTALEAQGGDPSLMAAVRVVRALAVDPAATRKLARGHHVYGVARELFETGRRSEAQDSFAMVLRIDPPSPPLIGWTRIECAASVRALREVRALLSTTDSVRNPAMLARTRWVLGNLLPQPDSNAARMLQYEKASAAYKRLGEAESYGGVRLMEAWFPYERGDSLQAYAMLFEILREVAPFRESIRLHNVLAEWAYNVSSDGMPRAARRMLEEDEKVAVRLRNPTGRPEALLAQAQMGAAAGLRTEARQDLEAAQRLMPNVETGNPAQDLAKVLQLSQFIVAPPRDPDSAAVALDSAMAYFKRTSYAWPLTMLGHRFELRLEAGNLDGAAADLDSLTASIRKVRDQGQFPFRAAVLERRRSHYDRLVMAYVRAGEPLLALQAVDRSRISFETDSVRRTTFGEWTPPPPGKVVLQYTLIGDTLLTWVVRRDSITLREQRRPRAELLRTIARADAALQNPSRDGDASPELRRLYDVLVRPVRNRIPPGDSTELVIVADGEIAGVSFAALMTDPRSERYLVEDHPISHAASLADAARGHPVARVDFAATKGRALLVANPQFDVRANLGLDQLQYAAAEVESLSALYPDRVVLEDTSATAAAFARHAAGARVVHYAGHALFDDTQPERSFLLLAGSGASGRLTADSVSTMELDGVHLVVLSACQTVRGGQGRSGGFAGLSGALLDAGVDAVVGSLWLVDDRRAQPLMLEFHRRYNQDPNPARALRHAQLSMIRDPELRSPALWAGFRSMGR